MNYRRRLYTVLHIVVGLIFVASAAAAGEVSQGKCLEFDQATHVIKIEEFDTNITPDAPYGKSTGNQLAFNVAKAKIGIPPQPGDVLRIAYKVEGDAKMASKVMNVSKQDLRKK